MMIKQIKTLTAYSQETLDEDVNRFLQDVADTYIDIKFETIHYPKTEWETMFIAHVIYGDVNAMSSSSSS